MLRRLLDDTQGFQSLTLCIVNGYTWISDVMLSQLTASLDIRFWQILMKFKVRNSSGFWTITRIVSFEFQSV
jgi:hypothetical protein